jgi:hypothetical protein
MCAIDCVARKRTVLSFAVRTWSRMDRICVVRRLVGVSGTAVASSSTSIAALSALTLALHTHISMRVYIRTLVCSTL